MKEIAELCRKYLHTVSMLDSITLPLSRFLTEKVVAAMHHDGLFSDVSVDDLHVTFRFDDAVNAAGVEDFRIYILLPSREQSVNGLVLKALSESLGLHPNQISVGLCPGHVGLSLWWYFDCMCSGLGIDWEKEISVVKL